MAKDLEFKDYAATWEDEDGDEHEHVIRAAEVGQDHVYVTDPATGNRVRREVMTTAGQRQVSKGDVYVETHRPGVYDYLTAEAWATTGYADSTHDGDHDGDDS